MKTKLALFDLDGTLFDTRSVNHQAYNKALEEYGYSINYETFASECNGRHYKVFLPQIMGGEEHMEEVHREKKRLYQSFLKSAVANEPLFQLIESIRGEYYTAVVTTASKENVDQILFGFQKEELFDLVLTQEDVHKKKPDPEGFLRAMEYFKIPPENTIIFEDSDVGLEAAERSGAGVFAVKGYA